MPYFLSLYLGPVALALAWAGRSVLPSAERRVLVAGGVVGAWYALGARLGLALVLPHFPGFGSFRFPSKAFLLPHLTVALLAGLGATRSREGAGATAVRNAGLVISGVLLGAIAALCFFGPALGHWANIGAAAFGTVRASRDAVGPGEPGARAPRARPSRPWPRGARPPGKPWCRCSPPSWCSTSFEPGSGMNPQVDVLLLRAPARARRPATRRSRRPRLFLRSRLQPFLPTTARGRGPGAVVRLLLRQSPGARALQQHPRPSARNRSHRPHLLRAASPRAGRRRTTIPRKWAASCPGCATRACRGS